ncbi:uncharacterized protein BCR38DRAFT_510163 [Pseudomassariella vexata]|uniref:Uncharacterized protein n=1 Tax=Pseudomassariella vexata TaxID=1141098 RepID=A0A1Y2E760_9PEZI|nr:uncharacterized protein BCR38DRAFT_510163 [Pseudomassariella vexata]ORY67369.1 hypothetical protein BCR38DRAFT_510163 [Pseudomassariella vexata]
MYGELTDPDLGQDTIIENAGHARMHCSLLGGPVPSIRFLSTASRARPQRTQSHPVGISQLLLDLTHAQFNNRKDGSIHYSEIRTSERNVSFNSNTTQGGPIGYCPLRKSTDLVAISFHGSIVDRTLENIKKRFWNFPGPVFTEHFNDYQDRCILAI